MKQAITFIVASSLFLIVLPFILLAGLTIYIKYPGPFFFKQAREGKNGKMFYIWKLRTMVVNATEVLTQLLENNQALANEWKEFGGLKKDPRIAGKIGRFVRQVSIDELPQLLNICKGEMAFVGPRPLEINLANTLDPDVRILRNSVKPGLTGLWQIGLRNNSNIQQMQRYDKFYLRNKGFLLDVFILVKTIRVVLTKTGI